MYNQYWFYLIAIEKTDGKKEYRVARNLSEAKETIKEWDETIDVEYTPEGYQPTHKSISMRKIELGELNEIFRSMF